MPNQPGSPFGPNDWLVDELYQQYLEDKRKLIQLGGISLQITTQLITQR